MIYLAREFGTLRVLMCTPMYETVLFRYSHEATCRRHIVCPKKYIPRVQDSVP